MFYGKVDYFLPNEFLLCENVQKYRFFLLTIIKVDVSFEYFQATISSLSVPLPLVFAILKPDGVSIFLPITNGIGILIKDTAPQNHILARIDF